MTAAFAVCAVFPLARGFVEEARSSSAAAKGRVLQRGAQIVATQRLVAGDSAEAAAEYLCGDDGLRATLEAAKFPVTACKITDAALDEKGLLTRFACTLEYDKRSYTVTFDISEHRGKVKPAE
ncbi:MAG: hypothetical protein RR209_02315 [Angelakisella sp.]